MAKHPEFKIVKKKMHKRPKKVSGSPTVRAILGRDLSCGSWSLVDGLACFNLSRLWFLLVVEQKGADARRTPPVYELHQMDTSGKGWFLPEEQGWEPYDPAKHGEIPADAVGGKKVVMVRPADWKQ